MYKKDLALNDLQWLICHQTKPNLVLLLKAREFSVHYCLLIAGRRDGFMPFTKALACNEMQIILSGILTFLGKFIFYDNCYAIHIIISWWYRLINNNWV